MKKATYQYDEFYTLLQTGFWIVRGLGSLVMKIRLDIDTPGSTKGLGLGIQEAAPLSMPGVQFQEVLD